METAFYCIVQKTNGKFSFESSVASRGYRQLYQVSGTGMLKLANASAAASGLNHNNIMLSGNELYFYSLNTGSHSISQFQKGSDASLTEMGEVAGLPAHAQGLAAF